MAWKRVDLVFPGGTDNAKKLYGKSIRVRSSLLEIATFDPARSTLRELKISLRVGQMGFVGLPPEGKLDALTLVFSHSNTPFANVEQMIRKPFHAIHINWATFRQNFDIDMGP